MNITIDRPGRSQQILARRIEAIADHTGRLVAKKLGGRVPDVEFVLSDAPGVVRLIEKADRGLGGTPRPLSRAVTWLMNHWTVHHAYAATTLASRGAVVFINGPYHRGDLTQLDRTIVHELAHTVQLTLPGARQQHIAYLSSFAARTPNEDFQKEYERLMRIREQ